MVRQLVLVTGDITRTAWFREGADPPEVTLPGDVRMRWLPHEEWQATPEMLETVPETVAERYRTGARCLIGMDTESGRVMYHLWVSEVGAYTPWIFRYVEPPPGHLLVFDVWAHPDCRGRNLHWAGATMAADEARRCRLTGIYAGVEEHEFLLFAAKYASLGLGLITPHVGLFGVKFFGLTMHVRLPPPPKLVGFSRKLRARYSGIYIETGTDNQGQTAPQDNPV